MRKIDLTKKYLCGIGVGDTIESYRVGGYDEEYQSFSFSNGSYSNNNLYLEPRGSNAFHVISYVSLEEINENGLLDVNRVTESL